MKIKKVQEFIVDFEETIITASLCSKNEFIALLSSGDVVRINFEDDSVKSLFTVKSAFIYTDGGFDINAPSTFYTLDSVVVLVNDYKRHGFVHYPDNTNEIHLWRGEYNVDVTKYPIALFRNEDNAPCLIYGNDWNHVNIMNLDTRQILTADKSLIEESAEEDHFKYNTKGEISKHPWPSPYDYFYGELKMSPDNSMFLSAGWAWGSYDAYNVYEVDHFLSSNRIADISVGGWEHCERAACWIDNSSIAVAINPLEEGDKNAKENNHKGEIHFYKIDDQNCELDAVLKIADYNFVNANMCFNQSINAFIIHSEDLGLLAMSLEGQVLFEDKNFKINEYFPKLNLYLKYEAKAVSVYELIFD